MIAIQPAAHATEADNRALSAVLELLVKLDRCKDAQQAFATVVAELRSHLEAQTVVVGLCQSAGRRCVVQAISGIAEFKADAELVRCIESALDEAVLRNALTIWPPPDDQDRHSALAHQRLCQFAGCKAVLTIPLRDHQARAIGALVVILPDDLSGRSEIIKFIRCCEVSLGACLWRWKEFGRSWQSRSRDTLRRRVPSAAIAIGAIFLLAAVAAFPVRHRLSCNCTVQPVTRRFVASPFDGKLEHALVAPGDVVSKGQVLARMDGRELGLELASLTADLNRASKQSDAALATHNISEAQLAQLEMDRIELKIQLLQQRAQQLDIKAPLAGVVVSGDLRKAEGAPLSTGQTLFEVAPLEAMVVEVSIPEDDIAYVQVGAEVKVRLDACADEPQVGTIARIHPRSEIRDERPVFIAEVRLSTAHRIFRPGMQGSARIDGPRASLAWSWLHKPWHKLIVALGW